MSSTKTAATGVTKSNAASTTHASRRKAEQAYERALTEAGIKKDDLRLLRELADLRRSINPSAQSPPPTRIYL